MENKDDAYKFPRRLRVECRDQCVEVIAFLSISLHETVYAILMLPPLKAGTCRIRRVWCVEFGLAFSLRAKVIFYDIASAGATVVKRCCLGLALHGQRRRRELVCAHDTRFTSRLVC